MVERKDAQQNLRDPLAYKRYLQRYRQRKAEIVKRTIIKKLIKKDSIRAYYKLLAVCTICGIEYESGNVFQAKYCPDCRIQVMREQNRERQRRHKARHNK